MKKTFISKYIFHFLYILVYIGFLVTDKPWFSRNNDWLTFAPTFASHLLLMFALVYLNTLVLLPKLLFNNKVVAYAISILVVIAAYTYFRSLYNQFIFHWLFPEHPPGPIADHLKLSFVYGVWFTVVSTMLYVTQRWHDQRQLAKNVEVSQLRTELKYLRSQFNPHFLFNGLNTIYGSIEKENQEARKVLLQFSDLLRYSIYEADTDSIALEKEVQHLENYIAFQRMRMDANVSIQTEFVVKDPKISIAPLLFLPILENAFKFVSRDDRQENFLRVRLDQTDAELRFSCENSFQPVEQAGGGIGLANLKRRLDLLYANKHALTIRKSDRNYYLELTIQL